MHCTNRIHRHIRIARNVNKLFTRDILYNIEAYYNYVSLCTRYSLYL